MPAMPTFQSAKAKCLLCTLCVLGLSGLVRGADGPPPANSELQTARARAAAQLFVQNCLQCHGPDGKGGPARPTMPDIPDFTDGTWQRGHTDPQLVVSILEGKGRLMPTWWGRINDRQAADLVSRIRAFGPAPAPAVTTNTAGSTTDYGNQLKQLRQQWNELQREAQALPIAVAPPPPTGTPTSGAGRFFGQNCAGCHTIGGGRLTGPDLKDVTKRRDRDWLIKLLLNPNSVMHSGDPYALDLLAKARGIIMPNIFGMTRERAETLLDFLDTQSQMTKSWFSELPISGRPLTAEDAEHGVDLFTGRKLFTNGGPACIGCHSAYGTREQGGKLGPDLTKVYERVGGRTPLTARLWTPVTPTMLPLYQQHALQEEEVLSLVAFLEKAAREGTEQGSGPPLNFLLMGLGATVLGLLAVNLVWGSGFRRREGSES